ncbi:UNVERIFIED_CONTAM: hypothetical protein GTU68_057423, partial [Idotea baltica]|nr:hypothetical protein [Idotea baltica]
VKYKRILLKLSGEALLGKNQFGIDSEQLFVFARQIKEIAEMGVEVAVVVGGGNIFRGVQLEHQGMDRAHADYMGMLGTIINAMALQSALEDVGAKTRVMSAIQIDSVCEPYIRRRAVRHMEKGKANPVMLNSVMVEYYGARTPLIQVAAVVAEDARTLKITPFDKSALHNIEKGIVESNLGFNPQNDGIVIRILVPQLTGERRAQLVKQARAEGEKAKVSIRNVRREHNDQMKKLKDDGVSEDQIKGGEEEIQKITNTYSSKVDSILDKKEEEITTI